MLFTPSVKISSFPREFLRGSTSDNKLLIQFSSLFEIIGQKLQEQIDDKEKLPIYAKTLRGLNQTLLLEEQIKQLKESLLAAQTINDFIDDAKIRNNNDNNTISNDKNVN